METTNLDIYGNPPIELYHLPADPGETRNLAPERSAVAKAYASAACETPASSTAATTGSDVTRNENPSRVRPIRTFTR